MGTEKAGKYLTHTPLTNPSSMSLAEGSTAKRGQGVTVFIYAFLEQSGNSENEGKTPNCDGQSSVKVSSTSVVKVTRATQTEKDDFLRIKNVPSQTNDSIFSKLDTSTEKGTQTINSLYDWVFNPSLDAKGAFILVQDGSFVVVRILTDSNGKISFRYHVPELSYPRRYNLKKM